MIKIRYLNNTIVLDIEFRIQKNALAQTSFDLNKDTVTV